MSHVTQDFSKYYLLSRQELTGKLCMVSSELANVHLIYATTLQAEKSARIHGFLHSEATSVSGKERDAEVQSLHLSLEVIELMGQIKAIQEEKDLLVFLLGEPCLQKSTSG